MICLSQETAGLNTVCYLEMIEVLLIPFSCKICVTFVSA